jgi:hypothetical protein
LKNDGSVRHGDTNLEVYHRGIGVFFTRIRGRGVKPRGIKTEENALAVAFNILESIFFDLEVFIRGFREF